MAKEMSLHDFVEYRDMLENSRRNRSSEMFFNDSDIHELFVVKELFANAVESSPQISTIYMYCGSMSAFRDSMQMTSEEVKKELYPGENALAEDMKEWNDFDPYAKLIARMKDFFNSGGRLEVIVDDDISSIVNEQIWRDSLSRYFNETKQLSIRLLVSDCGIEHFVVSGKAYRSEISHKEKTAFCCFNDPDYSSLLYSNFAFLQNSSRIVSI